MAQRRMPGSSASSRVPRCGSRSPSGMVTVKGRSRIRLQIPSSVPSIRGLWLVASQILATGVNSKNSPWSDPDCWLWQEIRSTRESG